MARVMTNSQNVVAEAPGPAGAPVLGILPEMRRQDMIDFYLAAWRKYGDVVRFQAGPQVMYLIVRPDDVKHVLVDNERNYIKGEGFRMVRLALGNGLFTAEGSLWRRQRRLMQPPFTPRSVKQFAPAMRAATEQMLSEWTGYERRGLAVNVNAEMMRLAMAIIARTMLSIDIGQEAIEAAQAFTYVLEYVSRHSVSMFGLPLWVPTPDNRQFRQALQVLDDFISRVIAERQRQENPPDDLLTMLIKARDTEGDGAEGMTAQQLRDEILTIFFAGHETTAQALTWTWYLLAEYSDVEARLHAELAGVLGGRMPDAEDMERLTYTEMVVQEAMRLYPPVWVFVRQAIGDDELGGYHIPAGSMIVLSQYLTHRHPAYWQDPERFDPERFSPQQSKDRPRYAYFPFGGGPRVCLGNSFAMLEAVLVVAAVAQRYRLCLLPGQDVRPRMVGTLRPGGPVFTNLQARGRVSDE